MFTKRSFLGKSRSTTTSTGPSCSDSCGGTGRVSSAEVVLDATKSVKGDNYETDNDYELKSFRRGLRDGSIHVNVKLGSKQSAKSKAPSQGGRPGLSFTDDIDDCEHVVIRKGVTSIIADPEAPDASPSTVEGDGGTKPSDASFAGKYGDGKSRHNMKGSIISGNMARDMYMDVDGERIGSISGLADAKLQHARKSVSTMRGVRKGETNRQMLGVVSADSDEEELEYYDTAEGDAVTYSGDSHQDMVTHFEYIDLSPFLSSRLSDIKAELQMLRSKLESKRQMAASYRSTPEKHQEVMKSIEESMSAYKSLNNEARALGGLRACKVDSVTKSLQGVYNNRKDISDCSYRMNRWLLCDVLRMIGIECDYSCGYLEETDDNGVDVSHTVRRQFESRLDLVEELTREQREYAMQAVDDFLKVNRVSTISTFMTDTITRCFTLQVPLDRLKQIYPSSLDLDVVDTNPMKDVVIKYKTLSGALSGFDDFKKRYPDDFIRLRIDERLQAIYQFYVLTDLLLWNPLNPSNDGTGGRLTEREWFLCLNRFHADSVGQLILDLIVPACINAIESWDVTSSLESAFLSQFLADTIANLPSDGRGSAIEKLSSVFMTVLDSRIGVLCLKDVGNLFKDSWVGGCLKFQIIQITSNVMRFSGIFTGNTLSKVVLDKLFINHLLPTLDFQTLMDAFAVAQFFTFIKAISPQLRIKNKTNAIVKSTAYNLGERNWESRFEVGGLLDRLQLRMTNAEYLHILDGVFRG
ncbi:hypothetical protein X943_001016 [Babesia divergens]|uniref:Uncharacterized protein n=1 Tax=Babesia divergens TaxID=32595 RepID=A0AAD9LHR8_BABDI|nr:hypothetical protein X943_001016 [Babesia divergens]